MSNELTKKRLIYEAAQRRYHEEEPNLRREMEAASIAYSKQLELEGFCACCAQPKDKDDHTLCVPLGAVA